MGIIVCLSEFHDLLYHEWFAHPKQKGNLGVGTDLAFVWLNSDRISTFSVGAGLRDKIEDGNGNTVKKVEPVFQISYTLSFGL